MQWPIDVGQQSVALGMIVLALTNSFLAPIVVITMLNALKRFTDQDLINRDESYFVQRV